jgi:hypothetical protein
VVVSEKSPGFGPVIVIPEMLRTSGPTLLMVTVLAALVAPTLSAAKARLVGVTLTMVPIPLRETLCGLLAALSTKLNVAARIPSAWGLNSTFTVHVAAAASVAPQLFDEITKSAGFVPTMVIELIDSAVVPVFFTVTDLDAESEKSRRIPKLIETGESWAVGKITPVPLSATLWGLFAALSATLNLALLAPFTLGVNVTLIAQFALTASDVPQLLVCVKSAGFVPVKVIPLIVNDAVPVFVRMTICAALATPTDWFPKLKEAGKSCKTGAPGAEKFTPVTFAPFTVLVWLAGVKV